MASAPAEEQRTLIEVADLDKQIARLERDNAKHPLRQEIATIMNAGAARARDLEQAKAKVEAVQASLAEAEKKSAALQSQVARKEAQLNSGEGLTSRDLLVLQDEIVALRLSLDAASDAEIEALEELEAAEANVESTAADIQALKETMLSMRASLEDEVTLIQAKQQELVSERATLLAPLSEDLVRIYERARSRGGYSVIAMNSNGTTDAGITISPVEVAQIKALPEDEIYLSEDYDCIIVRL